MPEGHTAEMSDDNVVFGKESLIVRHQEAHRKGMLNQVLDEA